MTRITILLLLLFTAFNTAFSQSTASIDNSEVIFAEGLTLVDDNNWSFYIDEDSKTYFIDFENINFNLSDIIVKDSQGKILFKDDVLDLPVDTIYELDFEAYGSGEYQVELRSFTSIIKKQVQIK